MSQRIVRLVVENIMRLRAVDLVLDPKKSLVLVRGDNGEGKSSLLDAVAFVIGGKRIQPPEVIRRGETYARVLLETEELVVERKWQVGESGKITDSVEVRSKEGAKFRSPQGMLDGLVSRLSFDPLHFLQLKAEDQAEALRKIVGLDFKLLDGRRLKAYDDRRDANRELASLQKRLEVHPVGVAGAPIDVAALLADQAVANGQARSAYAAEAELNSARAARAGAERAVKEAEAAMQAAYGRLKTARGAETAAGVVVDSTKPPAPEAMAQIAQKIATASSHNEQVRLGVEHAELVVKVAAAQAVTDGLSKTIDAIDLEKRNMTEAAKFPVAGLGFGEVGVTFDGFPFEQASGAARIRVSTGIGFAMNPELRVLRIKDGSLLDAKSMALLEQLATEADGQVLCEVVGKGPIGIVISDGGVESIDGVAVAA